MTFWAKKDFFKKSPAFFIRAADPTFFLLPGRRRGKALQTKNAKNRPKLQKKSAIKSAAAEKSKKPAKRAASQRRQQGGCPKAAARRRPKVLCRPQKQEIKLIGALKRNGKKSGRPEGRPLKRNFIYETAFSSDIVRHRSDSCAAYGKHFDPPRTESPSHGPHSRAAAQSAAVRAPPSDSWRR